MRHAPVCPVRPTNPPCARAWCSCGSSADVARFAFPPGTAAGRYVIHYFWGGYRDFIDVDVLPPSLPVPNTTRGIYGFRPQGVNDSYLKTDHVRRSASRKAPHTRRRLTSRVRRPV